MIALSDFKGAWRLTRRIIHDGGQQARFDGVATFEPLDAGADAGAGAGALLLREEGLLRLAGQGGFAANRCYRWGPSEEGAIAVSFDDGRPFHEFDPNAGACGDRHWCDPDLYAVRYDFSHWPRWSSRWRVDGPRKSYTMFSTYVRDDRAGA